MKKNAKMLLCFLGGAVVVGAAVGLISLTTSGTLEDFFTKNDARYVKSGEQLLGKSIYFNTVKYNEILEDDPDFDLNEHVSIKTNLDKSFFKEKDIDVYFNVDSASGRFSINYGDKDHPSSAYYTSSLLRDSYLNDVSSDLANGYVELKFINDQYYNSESLMSLDGSPNLTELTFEFEDKKAAELFQWNKIGLTEITYTYDYAKVGDVLNKEKILYVNIWEAALAKIEGGLLKYEYYSPSKEGNMISDFVYSSYRGSYNISFYVSVHGDTQNLFTEESPTVWSEYFHSSHLESINLTGLNPDLSFKINEIAEGCEKAFFYDFESSKKILTAKDLRIEENENENKENEEKETSTVTTSSSSSITSSEVKSAIQIIDSDEEDGAIWGDLSFDSQPGDVEGTGW